MITHRSMRLALFTVQPDGARSKYRFKRWPELLLGGSQHIGDGVTGDGFSRPSRSFTC